MDGAPGPPPTESTPSMTWPDRMQQQQQVRGVQEEESVLMGLLQLRQHHNQHQQQQLLLPAVRMGPGHLPTGQHNLLPKKRPLGGNGGISNDYRSTPPWPMPPPFHLGPGGVPLMHSNGMPPPQQQQQCSPVLMGADQPSSQIALSTQSTLARFRSLSNAGGGEFVGETLASPGASKGERWRDEEEKDKESHNEDAGSCRRPGSSAMTATTTTTTTSASATTPSSVMGNVSHGGPPPPPVSSGGPVGNSSLDYYFDAMRRQQHQLPAGMHNGDPYMRHGNGPHHHHFHEPLPPPPQQQQQYQGPGIGGTNPSSSSFSSSSLILPSGFQQQHHHHHHGDEDHRHDGRAGGGSSRGASEDDGDDGDEDDDGSMLMNRGLGSSSASAGGSLGDDTKSGGDGGAKKSRAKNLEKVPRQVIRALDDKMSRMPPWDTRITHEKLLQLGGVIMGDSSPVLRNGERSEHVTNYAPRNFHIKCQSCTKAFNGKNALRNFELHAIFWLLYEAHPALRTPEALADPEVEKVHRANYPCNSVSRDIIVYMEAKKPVLCNNQKKSWELHGDLHHDTSLFQGRAWVQIAPDRPWDSYKMSDPSSMDRVVCCRSGKTLEQYDTLRSHVFTWHDSGVFTNCTHCGRVYQNTRTFLAHGCVKKGHDKDEMLIASCAQHMLSLLDSSPDFATLYYQMAKLDGLKKELVFESVSKRLRSNNA